MKSELRRKQIKIPMRKEHQLRRDTILMVIAQEKISRYSNELSLQTEQHCFFACTHTHPLGMLS